MYSSIAKMATRRTNIALTTRKGQPSYQIDVKNVFFAWWIVKRSVHEATTRLYESNTCLGLFASWKKPCMAWINTKSSINWNKSIFCH